jgi:hypothetical protein
MTRAVVIIQAEHLLSALALATAPPFSLTEEEAAQLFAPAGSPTGDAPATHYWIAGLFAPTYWQALQELAMLMPWADCHAYDMDTQPDFPFTQLAALGLQPMKGDLP